LHDNKGRKNILMHYTKQCRQNKWPVQKTELNVCSFLLPECRNFWNTWYLKSTQNLFG